MKTLNTLFTLLFLAAMTTFAQTKSFNTTIPFGSENRTLSCFVPENYDSTQAYRLMICLHGLGDNSTNYRNALINSLNWPSLYPKTIFVCPDGGSDQNKDFYQPRGDQEIITRAIQFARENYTIDTQAIFLQGFSLGGRSALKFGLENPSLFKGLLLNTPALQGLMDVQNNPASSLQYNYANAANLPMFITVGASDYTYDYQIGALVKVLKKHNTPIHFERIANLAHGIPNASVTQKSFAFLVNQQVPHIDADLFEISGSSESCSSLFTTKVLVRNNGDSVIHSLSLLIRAGTTSTVQQWSGTILPNRYEEVPVSLSLPSGGSYTLSLSIAGVNELSSDENTGNNDLNQPIAVAPSQPKNTVVQNFDDTTTSWFIHPSGSMFEWFMDEQVKKSGTRSISSFNTALLFYSRNAVESFSSPFINISALSKKELNFDLAFTYFKYTPPYVATETNFADTLEILVSTDCGATYTSVYKKGGEQLSTTAGPIVNALNLQACSFIPTADQWRTETIDLSNFASAENALFRFNCISGMGGSLNIDNISFGASYVGINETVDTKSSFSMYPNPANEWVTIENLQGAIGDLVLMDITGKMMTRQPITSSTMNLSLTEIPEGLYFAQVTLGGQTIIQKLLIRK